MPVETTYSRLRENLSATLDNVVNDQEIVIVRRRAGKSGGSKDVALIPATELASLLETAHLMRSPKNAQRLLTALRRAERGGGQPTTVAALRRETGLGGS
jgi:antitoxin YefM